MASASNHNVPGGGPFDMQKLFKPSTPPPPTPSTAIASCGSNPPNISNNLASPIGNPNLASSPFPPPSASYPPPTGGASGGGYAYPPPTSPFNYHPVYTAYSNPSAPQQEMASALPQRSMSYPTPPLQPQAPTTTTANPKHPIFSNSPNPQNPNNHGARLMALLSAPPPSHEFPQQPTMPMTQMYPTSSAGSDLSAPQNVSNLPSGTGLVVSHQSVIRMPSSKLPKGRHLIGDRLAYDIDVRLPGEVQPQLEVTPITKYGSDPGLVLGRQIAVSKTYICYGLKLGNIRVLNINTALRSLLKGLAQRVTDMAFFAEDVHLLASASMDGRVYVWKISEGPDEEEKSQITGKIVVAIQISGEGESVHPRVCWHCHKQEILVVGIGKHVLRIDTTKVGKGEKFSAEEPLQCSTEKLLDGVQLVGTHDGEVTGLSMCQWMTTRLVSASVDGTIKIWEDRKSQPTAVLRPHDGQPVNSVTFLASPYRPDHIILITGGSLNREMKIWVSGNEEGLLLPSEAESWHCTQTLELKSTEAHPEEAFFNQVIALSQPGLLLLANAKRNAIYAVHLAYGTNPESTSMDYISEFTVTMPILSFTGTSELLPHDEQIVQVYCVQTQAIQQYALNLSQCLPPALENAFHEKTDSAISLDTANNDRPDAEPSNSKQVEVSVSSSAPRAITQETGIDSASNVRYPVTTAPAESPKLQEFAPSSVETKVVQSSEAASDGNISSSASPSRPLSPKLSKALSGVRAASSDHDTSVNDPTSEPKTIDYSVDRQMDVIHKKLSDTGSFDNVSKSDGTKHPQDDSIDVNHQIKFKHPTHLVTPSEILRANSTSEVSRSIDSKSDFDLNIQDVAVSNDLRNVEVEVKVVGETRSHQHNDDGPQQELHAFVSASKEKLFCSQASDLGIDMARECHALSSETYIVEEARQLNSAGETETINEQSTVEEVDSAKDVSMKGTDYPAPLPAQQQSATYVKWKKQKGKGAQGSTSRSPSPSAFNSADSSNEQGVNPGALESAFPQLLSMQENLNQLVTIQKEMQKQMSNMVSAPITKEGKRLEAALGRSMEKAVKANTDALWARFQEEIAKQDKVARERLQQLTNLITNCLNKDLPTILEKSVKRELAALGQSVTRTITPAIEKAISASIAETFQKGVSDKAVNQLEKSLNSKLEATVARQIQSQFQTSGKQVLQETLKSSLEANVIPAFEMLCRAMFEQVDTAFQKGLVEHTGAAQQHFDTSHSPLAIALRDALNSASSMTQTLSGEILDGQRKLLALGVAGANSKTSNPLVSQLSNGPLGGLHEKLEVPHDPTKELSRLVAERKYDEAFTCALQRSDVIIVSWLCSQVDLSGILSMNPLPLSQGVLLSLLQQLACDVSNDTSRKLTWMREVLSAINPTDHMILVHVRPIFEQVYQILNHHRNLPTTNGSELSNIRLLMHVINSMLMTSK